SIRRPCGALTTRPWSSCGPTSGATNESLRNRGLRGYFDYQRRRMGMAGVDDQSERGERRLDGAERALWRRGAATEIAEDEAERFLDLAGFADGRLDPDEHDRIAERLARDPE